MSDMSLKFNHLSSIPYVNLNSKLDYLGIGRKFGDEDLILSTRIFKINRKEKKQERIFLLTNVAIYNIKPTKGVIEKIQKNKISPKRRIELNKILSITLSTSSNQFTINIPSEYDYRFESFDIGNRNEIITAIASAHKHVEDYFTPPLSIYETNQFSTAPITINKKDNQIIKTQKINKIKHLPIIRLSTTELSEFYEQPMESKTDSQYESDDNLYQNSYEICTEIQRLKMKKIADPTIVSRMHIKKYNNYLVMGYIRLEIEGKYTNHMTLQHIPDEIKSLCIAYYLEYLVYNKYCDVIVQSHRNETKLSITTAMESVTSEKRIDFGGRMVSSVPMNGYNKDSTLIINVIDDGWMPPNVISNGYENKVCAVGLTSHPEKFMNAKYHQLFMGNDIEWAVYWIDDKIKTTDNICGLKEVFTNGGILNSDVIRIKVQKNNDIKIYKNNGILVYRMGATKFWKKYASNHDNKMPHLYWAVAFTVSTRCSVHYELFGDCI